MHAPPVASLLAPIEAASGPARFDPTEAFASFRRRELPRDEHWLRAGEVCRRLCFVESGLLRHSRVEPSGRRRTRWATLAGQYGTCFPSFTRGTPAEDDVAATEPTVAWELDRDRWAALRAEVPQLQAFWVATLEYLLVCFEDRVWSLISGDAEARYRYMLERYPEFLLSLPQHYVADLLGIGSRHLSRIRGNLQ